MRDRSPLVAIIWVLLFATSPIWLLFLLDVALGFVVGGPHGASWVIQYIFH